MADPDQKYPDRHPRTGILRAYETHADELKRFISRLLGQDHRDVEDVMQEAFLRAYHAESAKTIDQPKSFLFRIARNVAIDQMRQKTRKPTDFLGDLDDNSVIAGEWTLEDEISAQQKLEIHCAAAAALPPKCRRVYLMRKVYAMSYREIAEALNISVSTVETHLEKGFARCQAYVAARLDEAVAVKHQLETRRDSENE